MRVLDLFSGIGGFSLGLERAGMRTVAFCELDPYCRAVLRKHWPDVPCFGDVRDLHAGDLLYHVGPVDVIAGGFPCQDISTAGKGAGLAGERSGLWSEYRRLIEECRPRYAIIENVSALRSRGLDQVLGELHAIGYDAEWHCIPASAVGAPHRRDRVWVVAYAIGEQLRQQPGRCGWQGRPGASQPLLDGETWAMAYADKHARIACGAGDACQGTRRRDAGGSPVGSDVAYAERERGCSGHTEREDAEDARQPSRHPQSRPWDVEPDVGRVANGVSARVDRLRSLGNAVIPQIPELIGRAIMRAAA